MRIEERIDCPHTLRVLHGAGISTMEELARLSREDLLRLRGIGKVIAGDLERIVALWREEPPAQEGPRPMRLDGFGLMVEDMGAMIRFYRDVLGFEIREAEDTSNVYLIKDGTLFLLYGRKDFERLTGRPYEYLRGFNGHFEIALYVDTFAEVDEQFARVVAGGARPVMEPATEPWGQRTCYVADPEGNLIEIGSFGRPFAR